MKKKIIDTLFSGMIGIMVLSIFTANFYTLFTQPLAEYRCAEARAQGLLLEGSYRASVVTVNGSTVIVGRYRGFHYGIWEESEATLPPGVTVKKNQRITVRRIGVPTKVMVYKGRFETLTKVVDFISAA